MNNQIFIHVSTVSGNAKTGPIPVTTSSKNTCPDSCQLKGNGCYAESGRVNMHWQKVSKGERGLSFDDALDSIKALPSGSLVRHNQAGDLPGIGDGLLADENLWLAATLSNGKPRVIIGYPAHGIAKKKAEKVFMMKRENA